MRGARARICTVGGGLLALSAALFALAGCKQPEWLRRPEPIPKPPLHEEYVLPPTDDTRFDNPPNYPKETLDSGMMKKDGSKPGDPSKLGPHFGGGGGGGPGMGGY